VPDQVHDPVGCAACSNSGYAGRVGIFEIVAVGESLRDAIDKGASEQHLIGLSLDLTQTLLGQGLEAVAEGRTTVSETLRVVGDTL
jgi:general secretion pathway protein E